MPKHKDIDTYGHEYYLNDLVKILQSQIDFFKFRLKNEEQIKVTINNNYNSKLRMISITFPNFTHTFIEMV